MEMIDNVVDIDDVLSDIDHEDADKEHLIAAKNMSTLEKEAYKLGFESANKEKCENVYSEFDEKELHEAFKLGWNHSRS